MKEILFRIQEESNKKWYFGMPIRFSKNGETCCFQSFDNSYYNCFAEIKTLGQYTGLTDKNGNKIFEGDIISVGCNGITVSVNFGEFFDYNSGDYSIGWYVKVLTRDIALSLIEIKKHTKDCEIIGNIYDNSELLKGE